MTLDKDDIQAIAEAMAPMVARMISVSLGLQMSNTTKGYRPVDRLIEIAKVDREAAIKAAKDLFKQQTNKEARHA